MSRRLVLALAVASLSVVAACSGGGSSPSPSEPVSQDSISLVTIAPAGGTRLVPGSVVTFAATLRYQLSSAASGTILEVIENQTGGQLTTGPQMSVAVNRGQGSVQLADSITVPLVGVTQVEVFFPLLAEGATRTSIVATATYPVGP
ncbi:MAG TPA: hypothetical protein VHQ90_13695 [Thermoanaerobaculia bacterium]|nr:hypothetical protein [Thermoanaerobaculia bacterium]